MLQGLIDMCVGLLEWLIGLIPRITFFEGFTSAVSSIYGVLYEASVIIPFSDLFIASLIIWFLQTFSITFNIVSDSKDSILALIGGVIAPIFAPLGFGDWRASTALITGFTAKESVVSTMTVLLGGSPVATMFNTHSAIVFLVFTLLYTPCVAAITSVKRELGGKWAIGVVALQCGIAWIIAFLVKLILIAAGV